MAEAAATEARKRAIGRDEGDDRMANALVTPLPDNHDRS